MRFTPTRVGTTVSFSIFARFVSVHPHACGDDSALNARPSRKGGSPPRVWGRLPGLSLDHVSSTVHPHACGDDLSPKVFSFGFSGSPPRVWGRRSSRPPRSGFRPVHPHACGDDLNAGDDLTVTDRFTPTRVGTTIVL